jgi:hypothetical protein
MRQFELSTLEYYFLVTEFLVESKHMNIVFSSLKEAFLIPINPIYSLHSQETEVVPMFTFKRCRDIESGIRDLSLYVYNIRCSFMVSLDTMRS